MDKNMVKKELKRKVIISIKNFDEKLYLMNDLRQSILSCGINLHKMLDEILNELKEKEDIICIPSYNVFGKNNYIQWKYDLKNINKKAMLNNIILKKKEEKEKLKNDINKGIIEDILKQGNYYHEEIIKEDYLEYVMEEYKKDNICMIYRLSDKKYIRVYFTFPELKEKCKKVLTDDLKNGNI